LVEGRGEPVVLVHAIGCDHRMWDSLASDLASSRYRVLRVDVRGHGESPVPDGEYSLEGLADDVLALLDSLEIEKAHWVGLSMGGMIGQAFALAHPGRLRRLVLANTTSGYGPDGPKMWEARAKAVREGGMAAIAELVMQRYFSDEFRERHPEVVARMKERVLTTPAKGYISCCAAIRDLDSTAELGAIRARTLVIAGGKDAGTPPSMSEIIATRIPGSQLAVLAEAAHLSAVEAPEEFNTLVGNFLASP
ncbi:MAG TPA: 3-oxoadipate enol-lactonase, partial [Usitatibacter sp.]|nr:3-oxoadipate enol-lactonase [Usitatibacter sp.]